MTAATAGMVTVGVDTHKHVHVAVVIGSIGERLGDIIVPADRGGYEQLLAWAQTFGAINVFGVEGTEDRLGILNRIDRLFQQIFVPMQHALR